MPEEKNNPKNRPMLPAPGPRRFSPGMPAPKVKDTKKTLARLWRYLKQQKTGLFLTVLFVVITTLLSLTGPYLLGKAIDEYILFGDLNGLARIILQMILVYMLAAGSTWVQSVLMVQVSQKTVRDLRKDLFDSMQTLSLRFFDRHSHGELMSRLSNDVDNISMVLSQNITQLISSVLTLAGVVITMFVLNPWLAIASLAIVPFIVLLTRWTVSRTQKGFRDRQKYLGDLNGLVEETITGEHVIKAFVREDRVIADFEEVNKNLQEKDEFSQVYSSVLAPLSNLIFNIGYGLIAAVGGWLAVLGMATVGTVASFMNYYQQLRQPLNQVTQLFNTVQSALAGAERVFQILDEKSELIEQPDALPLETVMGEVVFDHVSFAYEPDVPVLKDVTLKAEPGQTIALVGPTGAGKTTIINLLSRFYDIDQGEIRIDGKDIRTFKKADLRRQLGIVLQDSFFFSDSVIENIRYGRLDAADEEVFAAAKLANADGFIRNLPEGYKTVLAERGSDLSQGQRQLLSIARAILADPGILILDEATSSVDTRTEMRIQEALLRLMEGRTSFVIAHRLSTIREADHILVINQGEIIEGGSHMELLEQKGFYYNLYMSQFKGTLTQPI